MFDFNDSLFSGTRSKKRGLDEKGSCANYVETEQVYDFIFLGFLVMINNGYSSHILFLLKQVITEKELFILPLSVILVSLMMTSSGTVHMLH